MARAVYQAGAVIVTLTLHTRIVEKRRTDIGSHE
jgi:hypothetical protein